MLKSSRFDSRLNQRGMALVTVLLVMLVLAILATGVVVIAMNNFNQSNTTVDHNQAYYVAEAGINYQVKSFETKKNSMFAANFSSTEIDAGITSWANNANNSTTLSTVKGVPRSYTTSAIRNGNNIIISATGTVGTVSRHLTKTIILSEFNITNAILTSGSMDLTKLRVIDGPVQTLSNSAGVTVTGGTQNPTQVNLIKIPTPPSDKSFLDVISGCEPKTSTFTINGGICNTGTKELTIKYDDSIPQLPEVIVPDPPTNKNTLIEYPLINNNPLVDILGNIRISSKTATATTYYLTQLNSPNTVFYAPSITIDGTVTDFKINLDQNVTIHTLKLDLKGSFTITGKGTLTIFVPLESGKGNEKIGFINNCPSNSVCGVKGDPPKDSVANKLIVVITGKLGDVFSFTQTGGGSIYLSILTKLNMSLDIGGTGSFNGFIATNGEVVNIKGTGNCNALIYAPGATITTSGTGAVTGALIGKAFVNNNSVPPSITYNSDFSTPPFGFLGANSNIVWNPTVEN